jgi:fumarate reductase subunit D
VILESGSTKRSPLQWLLTLTGATGLALLVPIAILLVGLPVALGVRGIVEAVAWLAAFVSK